MSYTKVFAFDAVFREINELKWLDKAGSLTQNFTEATHGLACDATARQVETCHVRRHSGNHGQNIQQTWQMTHKTAYYTLKNNVNTENQINTSKPSDEVAPTTLEKF